MAAVSNTSKQPFLAVAINLDEVMTEVVDILQMAKDEVGIITRAVNERMNKSAEDTVNDVLHIVGNVKVITDNLAHTTGTFYQPVLFTIILLLFILIMAILCLLCALKTRREYKKCRCKIVRRWIRRRGSSSRVEPHQAQRSTSVLSAEEGRHEEYATTEKKRNDTLV